jgi:hypothetical protein
LVSLDGFSSTSWSSCKVLEKNFGELGATPACEDLERTSAGADDMSRDWAEVDIPQLGAKAPATPFQTFWAFTLVSFLRSLASFFLAARFASLRSLSSIFSSSME